ncbi:MAG: SpoIIE family protein phosphatase [Bernardetiaceae bacterium]|nr:SpoIIE family protein phosphatase [Bernardetiaceae bacterium]
MKKYESLPILTINNNLFFSLLLLLKSVMHQRYIVTFLFMLFALTATKQKLCAQPQTQGFGSEKQITQYIITVWNKSQELSRNTVHDIVQDQQGYLWLATDEGLVKYDGQEFQSLSNKAQTGAILKILPTGVAKMYMATQANGLWSMDNGVFQPFSQKDGLPDDHLHDLALSEQGLWIATDRGLALLHNQEIKIFKENTKLPSQIVKTLWIDDKDQSLWIGTAKGLCLAKNQSIIKNYPSLQNKSIEAITKADKNKIWIGTDNGLFLLDTQTDRLQRQRGLNDEQITDLYQDKEGTLWVATVHGGLHALKPSTETFESLTKTEGLPGNYIKSIFQDREANIWLGFERRGLAQIRDSKVINFTTKEGLPDNMVNTVFENQKGQFWIGTQGYGLAKVATNEQKIRHTYRLSDTTFSDVRAIAEDSAALWIAFDKQGLFRFKENANQGEHFKRVKNSQNLHINTLYYNRKEKKLWVGAEQGLFYLKKDTLWQAFQNQIQTPVMAFEEDTKTATLWIGTAKQGIFKFKNQKLEQITVPDSLAMPLIQDLYYEHKNNKLWIGAHNGFYYEKQGEIVPAYKQGDNFTVGVRGITMSQDGRFWLTTSNGVYVFTEKELSKYLSDEKATLALEIYDEADGLLSTNCAVSGSPSVLMDRFDRVWVPTAKGVSILDTRKKLKNLRTPMVVIEALIVNGESHAVYQNKVISLAPGVDKMVFQYDALTFIAPEKVAFRYKLEPQEEDWHEVFNERLAYYGDLAPGTYKFIVKAANSDGIWSSEETSVTFVVKPYWYQQIVYQILIILLILFAFFGFFKWRLRDVQKRNEELENTVEERTEEIRKKGEELETINNIIKSINREVHFGKVLNALLERGIELFEGASSASLLLFKSDDDCFEVAASFGYADNYIGRRFNFREVTNYIRQGRVIEGDFYKAKPYSFSYFMDKQPAFSLVMPLVLDRNLEAIIFIDFEQDKKLGESDLRQMKRFSEQAVSAFFKAKSMQEIEFKKETLESTVSQLSDSIQYARRIQQALLYEQEEVVKHFADAFIFYKPRDVVSGDFYWFYEEDNRILLASIDCTGHGVPGAFMTVMANAILNQIVRERKVWDPAKILTYIDEILKSNFTHKENTNTRNDGMDMSVIVYQKGANQLAYAGAKSPLLLLRNGQMRRYKGSKHAIGHSAFKHKKVFNSELISIRAGDIVYLYTDGFQDQFGGDFNRKFMSAKFRDFLLEYSYLTMPEQAEKLEEAFQLWKGKNKQTDDILVIGLRF